VKTADFLKYTSLVKEFAEMVRCCRPEDRMLVSYTKFDQLCDDMRYLKASTNKGHSGQVNHLLPEIYKAVHTAVRDTTNVDVLNGRGPSADEGHNTITTKDDLKLRIIFNKAPSYRSSDK
jgi:hypothetical protein